MIFNANESIVTQRRELNSVVIQSTLMKRISQKQS